MAKISERYCVQTADLEQDEETTTALWAANLASFPPGTRKLDWFYRSDPNDGAELLLLLSKEEQRAVGVAGLGRRLWRFGSEEQTVGLGADFVVNSGHRSLGPALMLMEAVVDSGRKRFPMQYGFPNRQSHVIVRWAGYQELGNMVRYARPLRYFRHLKPTFGTLTAIIVAPLIAVYEHIRIALGRWRAAARWNTTHVESFDSRFDRLWTSTCGEGCLMARRDATFLEWRYSDVHGIDYHRFVLEDCTSGEIGGYVVYHNNGGAALVNDFLALDARTLASLLDAFVAMARDNDFDSVSLEFFGRADVVTTLRRRGFRVRDSQPVMCVWNLADDDPRRSLPWYLTKADRD